VEGDIDVFVNGGGNEEAAEGFIIRGQVGAATAKGDAQRGTGDNHIVGKAESGKAGKRKQKQPQVIFTGLMKCGNRKQKRKAETKQLLAIIMGFMKSEKRRAGKRKTDKGAFIFIFCLWLCGQWW
jgi:hypothetical protein